MRRSGRLSQLALLLTAAAVLLGGVWPAHRAVSAAKDRLVPPARQVGNLSELDSFTLGLLLGGFRGPLVMYVWIAGEEEKNREDTSRLLTRAELISQLQPQFVSVYLYESWNLAYNVSVQYTRRSEKYLWIIRGIQFAEKGERRLPNDTDILTQLSHLYFDKLGSSFEADFYREHFRAESLEQKLDEQSRLIADERNWTTNLAGRWRYIDRLDGLVEAVRAGRTKGRWDEPTAPPPPSSRRHAWPYGLSVYAIAYDYARQAKATQLFQPHHQYGEGVVSTRPAIIARAWADEELNLGLAAEERLWPRQRVDQPLPLPTAELLDDNAADKPKSPSPWQGEGRGEGRKSLTDGEPSPLALPSPLEGRGGNLQSLPAILSEARFHYAETQRVCLLAEAGYRSHLRAYRHEAETFEPHLSDVRIKQTLAEAGAERLEGIAQWLAARAAGDSQALAAARARLENARLLYLLAEDLIRDYLATEYRLDPWTRADPHQTARARYNRLLDAAARAIDQIGRMGTVSP